MKCISKNLEPIMVPYDDDNINHVLSGPDYGQPWGVGWTEETYESWLAEKDLEKFESWLEKSVLST